MKGIGLAVLKRLLLASLLLGRLAWALPTPSPFELECTRLEPPLGQYDPTCPARFAKLREQAQNLSPGPDRAHFFWLASIQADLFDDRTSRDRFRQLAVAEPGVAAPRLADWLRATLRSYDLRQLEQNRLLQQLSSLYERHPDDEVLWHLQMAQAQSASASGQESLAHTLRLGALRLAERHR